MPAGTTIGNVQVKLNATSADDGQLYAYLVAPNGKTIALVDNRGGTGANFTNTVFSQQATTAISAGKAPFSGTYLPESSLSQLDGLSAGGSWRLMIVNSGGSSDTLLNWSLILTPVGGTSSSIQTASVTSTASSDAETGTGFAALVHTAQVSGQSVGASNFLKTRFTLPWMVQFLFQLVVGRLLHILEFHPGLTRYFQDQPNIVARSDRNPPPSTGNPAESDSNALATRVSVSCRKSSFGLDRLRARPIITSTVSRDAQRSATATRSAARRG